MHTLALICALATADAASSVKDLDRVQVKRQIRQDLRTCYTPFIRQHPRPPGTLSVSVTITPGGTTTGFKATGLDALADECVRSRAAAWRFANPGGGNVQVELALPAAEIDPDAAPIGLTELRPLLTLPASATLLEPLDDDGLNQLRERLCLPGEATETGATETASRLARALEATAWKVVVTPDAGQKLVRRIQASQKGYKLGGRVTPWAGPRSRCQGYDVALSIRAPHAAPR